MKRLYAPLWSHCFDLPSNLEAELVFGVWKALTVREALLAGVRKLWRIYPDGREFQGTCQAISIPLSPVDYSNPDSWLCLFRFADGSEVSFPASKVVDSPQLLEVKSMPKISAASFDTELYFKIVQHWREQFGTDAVKLQDKKLVIDLPYPPAQ